MGVVWVDICTEYPTSGMSYKMSNMASKQADTLANAGRGHVDVRNETECHISQRTAFCLSILQDVKHQLQICGSLVVGDRCVTPRSLARGVLESGTPDWHVGKSHVRCNSSHVRPAGRSSPNRCRSHHYPDRRPVRRYEGWIVPHHRVDEDAVSSR